VTESSTPPSYNTRHPSIQILSIIQGIEEHLDDFHLIISMINKIMVTNGLLLKISSLLSATTIDLGVGASFLLC
jgi:hypothetical protein